MSSVEHHSFGAPFTAEHWPGLYSRRRRTPGAVRKAKSRPLVKGGGGVAPVPIKSLVDAAYWLTHVEGFPCEPTRESVGRAMAEYVQFRLDAEEAHLLREAGRA